MPRWLSNVFALVITFAVPIVLILSNVLLFMNPAWLAWQYSQPGFPKAELFSEAERLYFGAESIEYVRGNRTLEQFKALGVYQEREIKHMLDVRVLVDRVKIVLPLVALMALVALGGLARQADTRALAAQSVWNGARLTIGIFIAIGISALVSFHTVFTLFHRIFFEGDTWLFNYTDSLIQFYPLPFWFATSMALVGLTIGQALIVGAIGWWWRRAEGGRQPLNQFGG